jgi:hypothetical protein
LQAIAAEQAQAAEQEAARATFAEALEAAKAIAWEGRREEALRALLTAQVQGGENAMAVETARGIPDDWRHIEAIPAVALAQARAGFGTQSVQTTAAILTERNQHLPKIAAAFVATKDKEHFKHLLMPCAYYLDAAYQMCGLLAQLYPEQATAIIQVIQEKSSV